MAHEESSQRQASDAKREVRRAPRPSRVFIEEGENVGLGEVQVLVGLENPEEEGHEG